MSDQLAGTALTARPSWAAFSPARAVVALKRGQMETIDIDMPLKAMQQIDEGMNIADWQRLKDLLNFNEKWRQLGVAMEIADGELDRIAARGISMCGANNFISSIY